MGRKRKPTYLKVLTGNPGRRPLPVSEPSVDEPLGDPPAEWKPKAKQLWWELQGQIPCGVATRADRMLLELAVRLIGKVREENDNLTPALAGQIRACLAAFGMTPADRAKLVRPPVKAEGAARFFSPT